MLHDGAARPISVVHDLAQGDALGLLQLYDGAGNVRLRLDDPKKGPAKPGSEEYRYDSLYRLTRHERGQRKPFDAKKLGPPSNPLPPSGMVGQKAIDAEIGAMAQDPASYTYRYDASGNREEERRTGGPSLAYSTNALNQYEGVGQEKLDYGENGNLIEDGTRGYLYDHRNLLVRVRQKASGTDVLSLFYDALGRLVCAKEGAASLHFLNDGTDAIEEYAGGKVAAQYVRENGVDRVCQAASGGKEMWHHRDHAGSTRLLTDEDARIPADGRYEYHPFGAVLGSPKHPNPFLFCGKRLFRTVGVYDSRARQNSPALGRFVQRDPKGTVDGPNLYLYAANTPATFVDPLGTEKRAAQERAAAEEAFALGHYSEDSVLPFGFRTGSPIEQQVYRLKAFRAYNWDVATSSSVAYDMPLSQRIMYAGTAVYLNLAMLPFVAASAIETPIYAAMASLGWATEKIDETLGRGTVEAAAFGIPGPDPIDAMVMSARYLRTSVSYRLSSRMSRRSCVGTSKRGSGR